MRFYVKSTSSSHRNNSKIITSEIVQCKNRITKFSINGIANTLNLGFRPNRDSILPTMGNGWTSGARPDGGILQDGTKQRERSVIGLPQYAPLCASGDLNDHPDRELSAWRSQHICGVGHRAASVGQLAVWCSGNALVSINAVALHRARLVLGWVTPFGQVNCLIT